MSVLKKLQLAIETQRIVPVEGNRPFLLFDSAREFIEGHSLVRALKMDAREVHRALLGYHAIVSARPCSSSGSAGSTVTPTCTECRQGYMIVDHVNGCETCDRCGAVGADRLNIVPEYVEELTVPARQNRKRGIPGVAQWLVHRMIRDDDSPSFFEELEHWNHYARLPRDDLHCAERNLQRWTLLMRNSTRPWDSSHTRAAQIVAALLYSHVRERFSETATIRSHVRFASLRHLTGNKKTLARVDLNTPTPTFFCPSCHVGLHDRKSAKWHCRGKSDLSVSKCRRL